MRNTDWMMWLNRQLNFLIRGIFKGRSESLSNSLTHKRSSVSHLLLRLKDIAAEDIALSISGNIAEDLQILGVV